MSSSGHQGTDEPHLPSRLPPESDRDSRFSQSSPEPSSWASSTASFRSCTAPESSNGKSDSGRQNGSVWESFYSSPTQKSLSHSSASRQLSHTQRRNSGELSRVRRASFHSSTSPSGRRWSSITEPFCTWRTFRGKHAGSFNQGTLSTPESDASPVACAPKRASTRWTPRRASKRSSNVPTFPNMFSNGCGAPEMMPHSRSPHLPDYPDRNRSQEQIPMVHTPENGSRSGSRAPCEVSEWNRSSSARIELTSSPEAHTNKNNHRGSAVLGVQRTDGVERDGGTGEGPSSHFSSHFTGGLAAAVVGVRTLLPKVGTIWSRVSDSVWRMVVVVGGTSICCSCVTVFFLAVASMSFLLLSAYVTPPPLAEFPVYFDYFPALSEALSTSPFVSENFVPPTPTSSVAASIPSPVSSPKSSVPMSSWIQVNSTWSVSIPSAILVDEDSHGGSAFRRRCSTGELSPFWSYLCHPSVLDLLVRRPARVHRNPRTWEERGEFVGLSDSGRDFDIPVSVDSSSEHEKVWRGVSWNSSPGAFEASGDFPWSSYLMPGSSSIAVAAVPFSNRSWEFLPADAQMYAPPAPLSVHGKTKRAPVPRMAQSTGEDEDLSASFFATLDASQLPADNNLDVYLTTSYPLNRWNSQLPPVMLSLLLFSSNHTPVAKATRSLLPGTPTDRMARSAAVVPEHSWTSWLAPSSWFATVFSLFPLTFFRAPETRPTDVFSSMLFFEAFPFPLTRRVQYAQVLMYPPLHASRAALVFVPKLHGFRAFLAAHWSAVLFFLVVCLFFCCASCTCCGALGLTYFVLPLGINDLDDGSNAHIPHGGDNTTTERNQNHDNSPRSRHGSLPCSCRACAPLGQTQSPDGISRPNEAVPLGGCELVPRQVTNSVQDGGREPRLMDASKDLPANDGKNHPCSDQEQHRFAPDVNQEGTAREARVDFELLKQERQMDHKEGESSSLVENELDATLPPSLAGEAKARGLELRKRRPSARDD
ncbi:putative transmembrane protein [Toxoplasma gondii CAST]|uniref:Putative transmembrane protein n=1 Tax=Toxoplasma gondii CAST TaxID=943122 RepID=A0A3R7YN52_TOXGO|nr:putative transmembrane protein [Toxoplasma gondii CAST]